MRYTLIAVLAVALVVIIIAGTGCAGYREHGNGSIDTWGIMRTLTVRKDYYKGGEIKSKVISTDSTTKDVLLGLNTLLDSAVNTASKAMP